MPISGIPSEVCGIRRSLQGYLRRCGGGWTARARAPPRSPGSGFVVHNLGFGVLALRTGTIDNRGFGFLSQSGLLMNTPRQSRPASGLGFGHLQVIVLRCSLFARTRAKRCGGGWMAGVRAPPRLLVQGVGCRRGLAFKAHRLAYHSISGSRVVKKKKKGLGFRV